MATALGLHDRFIEQGFWWLQGHDSDQVGGTLTYDPQDGAQLELLGMLRDMFASFNAMPGRDGDGKVTIHGITIKGKPVTLLHALNVKRQLNMPGIANETWKSNLLVLGFHLSDPEEDAIFTKSYLRFEAIESWLEHRPFTATVDTEAKTLAVLAAKPREVPFAKHADFELTSVGSLHSNDKPATRFTIEVTSQLAITPPEPRSLNWHIHRAVRIQELASLCTGHYLPLTSLELSGPNDPLDGGGGGPAEVHVYARMIHPDVGHRPKHETPVLTGPELIRFSPNAVQLWFDQYDVFDPAIRLFFTISGAGQMFTNIRMLLAIQALEVFHRRTSNETIIPEADFANFHQAIVNAIPAGTEPRMSAKLKGIYQYANELSLNQRLRSIIADLSTAFGGAPAGFDKGFLRKLVDTRNYYTHFSAELSDQKLDGAGMYWASRRVILLLTLLFLQRLGIAATDIAPLLKRHREFAQLWASADRPY